MADPLEEHRFQKFTFSTPSETGLPAHRRPYRISSLLFKILNNVE